MDLSSGHGGNMSPWRSVPRTERIARGLSCHLPPPPACNFRGSRAEKEEHQGTMGNRGGDIWRDGSADPRRDMEMSGKIPFLAFWASCMLQCSRRKTKAKGRRRPTANILLAQPCHMPLPPTNRTKRIYLFLEYQPCPESGNAPEGTSKNV